LAGHQEPRTSRGCRLVAAVDAHGLFREVTEKLCGVSDFATGLGQRLAHLQRHHQCEVVDTLVQQLERAGEDVGAVAWRHRREFRLGGDGRVHRGQVVHTWVRS
jgi:hypothetical protein